MEPFAVSVTTGLRLQDFNVIVTPKEETTLTDLKEGEGDPVIKWSFSWTWEDRKYNTRLGFNKIENRILGMNDPDHKETVFLETIQEVKGFMGGEVHTFLAYPPLPSYDVVKNEVIKVIQKTVSNK